MSPILLLSIALQIACAVHVIRTGRPMYWIFILLIGSFIGVAIYFFAEIVPELRHSRGARRVVRGVQDRIDPQRQKRHATRQLDIADTHGNRQRLADESLASGDFQHAAELYRSALKGLYETDPTLMLGLAKAQFGLGEAGDARRTLEELIAANPGFRSSEGHLLYARAVEAQGDVAAALHEYETLVQGYPGEEGRVRHALLLKKQGDAAQAEAIFREVLKRVDLAPKYYGREQREWVEIAKRELA